MVIVDLESERLPKPELERAGRGVDCSVVSPEEPEGRDLLIMPGYGGRTNNYYNLQLELARSHGVRSFCVEPPEGGVSFHLNRRRAEALQTVHDYAREAYGAEQVDALGHSWGGSSLASKLNHNPNDVIVAIFMGSSGAVGAISGMLAHPIYTGEKFGKELQSNIDHFHEHPLEDTKVVAEAVIHLALHLPSKIIEGLVASEHLNLIKHLRTARAAGVILAGLWSDEDFIFHMRSVRELSAELFHFTHVFDEAGHLIPQKQPKRVAQAIVNITRRFPETAAA